MTWTEFILHWSAADVMAWTDAPKRTVYDWRNGASPPSWLQPILVAHITRKSKKPNKPAHTIPPRRGKTRKDG